MLQNLTINCLNIKKRYSSNFDLNIGTEHNIIIRQITMMGLTSSNICDVEVWIAWYM